MTLFSKRYSRALREKDLSVSLTRRLRARVWSELLRHNESYYYHPDPSDNWTERSTYLEELEKDLKREYGAESLLCYNDAGERVPCELSGFILRGLPWEVLDAIEYYLDLLGRMADSSTLRQNLQAEINRIFVEEAAPWRVSEGEFFQVDSQFMAVLLETAEEKLRARGFGGAHAELRDARNDLTAGDHKGAIVNACKAFESAMKTMLGTESGSASLLVRKLKEEGYLDDLPEPVRGPIGEAVLMALPTLRNKLGGHGQGEDVVVVPRHYAELAVNLAATFLTLCIEVNSARREAVAATVPGQQNEAL
jgi:hypothetical protein